MMPLTWIFSSLTSVNSDFRKLSGKEWRCLNWREAYEGSQKAGDEKSQEDVLIQSPIPHISSCLKTSRGDYKMPKIEFLADTT